MNIGILGGTFNPVHNGHLAVAQTVYSKANLSVVSSARFPADRDHGSIDRILLVPAYDPPHKENDEIIPYEERWNLVNLAVKSYPYLEASKADYTPGRKSYTRYLIERLQEEYPQARFFFIIGADNIPQIAAWFDYQWLLDNIQFIAVTRSDFEKEKLSYLSYYDDIIFIDMEPVNISSEMIRQKLKNREDISGLVPDEVAEYIKSGNLYT